MRRERTPHREGCESCDGISKPYSPDSVRAALDPGIREHHFIFNILFAIWSGPRHLGDSRGVGRTATPCQNLVYTVEKMKRDIEGLSRTPHHARLGNNQCMMLQLNLDAQYLTEQMMDVEK